MKIKTPKLHLPKLTTILWAVLAIAVVAELGVLYLSGYLKIFKVIRPDILDEPAASSVLRIDKSGLEQLQLWIEKRASFTFPEYSLYDGSRGRENPFLEY